MDKATYISRKVMDRYMDKVDIRMQRLWKRIVKLEGTTKALAMRDLRCSADHACRDPTCKYCLD